MFTHLNHLSQLTLFLVQACVLLLFLAQLGGGVKQKLEVCGVSTILKEVDLGEELLLLLFKLCDFFLELGGVHALLTEGFGVRMHRLELSLQVLVHLKGVTHVLVMHVLVGDLQGHQELSSVCLSLQVWQSAQEPVKNVLKRAFLTIDYVAAVVRVKVTWVAEDLKEATYTFLRLLLRLLLHIDGHMCVVEVGENAVDELEKLKWCLVIEFDHAQVLHEGWAIQTINDQLNLLCVEVGRLG